MQWKMGRRVIKVTGLSEAHTAMNASSLFDSKMTVETISAQRMRRIAKKEPVYLMVVRTNEDGVSAGTKEPTNDDQIVTVNEDTTRTEYPVQVEEFVTEFADIFPKELPAGLPPQCQLDHRIELVPGVAPPHRAPLSHVATGVGRAEEIAEGTDRKGLYPTLSFTFRGARPLCPQKGRRSPHVCGL